MRDTFKFYICPIVSKKYLNNFSYENLKIVQTKEIFYSDILVKEGQRLNKIEMANLGHLLTLRLKSLKDCRITSKLTQKSTSQLEGG